jgi:hypothetical protein
MGSLSAKNATKERIFSAWVGKILAKLLMMPFYCYLFYAAKPRPNHIIEHTHAIPAKAITAI